MPTEEIDPGGADGKAPYARYCGAVTWDHWFCFAESRLYGQFHVVRVLLYGSVARGEADEESGIDLLILTAKPLSRPARHDITDVVFDVNLHYGTNFSTLVAVNRLYYPV